jgi:hypothetical protein
MNSSYCWDAEVVTLTETLTLKRLITRLSTIGSSSISITIKRLTANSLIPLQYGGIGDDEGFYRRDGILVLGIDRLFCAMGDRS